MERAAEQCRALGHSPDTGAVAFSRPILGRRVLDRESHCIGHRHRDRGLLGHRVFDDVGQGLLGDPIQRRTDRTWQLGEVADEAEVDVDAGLAVVLDEPDEVSGAR